MEKVGKEYYTRDYWIKGDRSGYKNYNQGWPIHDAIAEMILSCFNIEPMMKVLDWGGCFGYHVERIQRQTGCVGFVVDASEWAIAHAHRALAGRSYWLDVGESPLPFPADHFDFCLAIEILEHIYEPEVSFALSHLFRVMKPGGMIYASIDVVGVDGKANTEQSKDASHQCLKPLDWWMFKFVRHGFEVAAKSTLRVKQFESTVSQFQGSPLAERLKWTQIVLAKP